MDLMELCTCKPVPDNEEEDVEDAVPENKLTLDNQAQGFQQIKAFDFFDYMELSMLQTLKLKHTVEEGLVP